WLAGEEGLHEAVSLDARGVPENGPLALCRASVVPAEPGEPILEALRRASLSVPSCKIARKYVSRRDARRAVLAPEGVDDVRLASSLSADRCSVDDATFTSFV